jgi:hypothetical protein
VFKNPQKELGTIIYMTLDHWKDIRHYKIKDIRNHKTIKISKLSLEILKNKTLGTIKMQDFGYHKNEDIKDQNLKTSGLIKMNMTSGSLKIKSIKANENRYN